METTQLKSKPKKEARNKDPRQGHQGGEPKRKLRRRISQHYKIADKTGSLHGIRGHKVLIISDIENLTHSANDWHKMIDHRGLLKKISDRSSVMSAHAVYSVKPCDSKLTQTLTEDGYQCHPQQITEQRTHRGIEYNTNSDFEIVSTAFWQLRLFQPTCFILATGDGDLGCSIVRQIYQVCKSEKLIIPTVMTLSIAGCTSLRLASFKNPLISTNIEIGLDCMSPLEDCSNSKLKASVLERSSMNHWDRVWQQVGGHQLVSA